MTAKTVTVIAHIKVISGMEETFKQEFQSIVSLTRKEAGCINYDLHQAADNPSLFLLYENWESQAALDKHLAMPYIQSLGEKGVGILAEPPNVTFWKRTL